MIFFEVIPGGYMTYRQGAFSVLQASLKLWKNRLRYGKLTKALSYRCSDFCSFAAGASEECSELCLFAAGLSDTVVDLSIFYYHLTTIHCRDLPRFAELARFSGRYVRFGYCANRGKTSP